jgi:SagB-type dehydrogenase family enzyme
VNRVKGALRKVPEFPSLVGPWRPTSDGVLLEDPARGRSAVVSHVGAWSPGSAIVALCRCYGYLHVDEIVASVGAGERDELLSTLATLAEAGFVVDARRRPDRLLAELQRFAPGLNDELAVIQARPGWRDRRANRCPPRRPLPFERPPAGERRRSLPLVADGADRSTPLTPEEVLTILALSYRTEGTWKPVASAGRLWPLVIHALIPQEADYGLYWFDPDGPSLRLVDPAVPTARLSALFIQSELSKESVARERPIVVVSLDLSRIGPKYGNRGALYAVLEAGALGHQITLSAGSREAAVRMVCGFGTDDARELLAADVDPLMLMLLEREGDR